MSMWRVLREEAGEIGESDGKWITSVWDINTWRKWKTVIISIVCPWITLTEVRLKLDECSNSCTWRLCNILFYAVPFYLWIVLLIASYKVSGLSYVGWSSLIFFFAFASMNRSEIREMYGIEGNLLEDFFSFMLLYPLACMQLSEQYIHGPSLEDIDRHVMVIGEERTQGVTNTVFDPGDIKTDSRFVF